MKIATSAYPIDWLSSWEDYERKIESWVAEAAKNAADLIVFPEYGAMELASLAGASVAGDLEASLYAVSDLMPKANALHARLSQEHNLYILATSAPVKTATKRPVNRTHFFAPNGGMIHQDKQIMTRFERETWKIAPGGKLRIIETPLAKIGILICYDSEFPLLGRALKDCDIILVPSCTDSLAGYWRVRIGAMARALEQQCVTVMASTVGTARWSPAVDENVGTGGIFCPPDRGFPETGILALGTLNAPGWTYADVDIDKIARVRANGQVLNRDHWDEQATRASEVTNCQFS